MGFEDPSGPRQREAPQSRCPEVEGLEQAGWIHIYKFHAGTIQMSNDHQSLSLETPCGVENHATACFFLLQHEINQADEGRAKALFVHVDRQQGPLDLKVEIDVVLLRPGIVVFDGFSQQGFQFAN